MTIGFYFLRPTSNQVCVEKNGCNTHKRLSMILKNTEVKGYENLNETGSRRNKY